MIRATRTAAFAVASLSLIVSSTAIAAPSASAAPQVDSWTALSALSGGAPAAAVCGAAAAAAAAGQGVGNGCVLPQTGAAPTPVTENVAPPPPAMVAGVGPVGFPPIPVLLVLAGVLGTMLAIAVSNHDHAKIPNSPA